MTLRVLCNSIELQNVGVSGVRTDCSKWNDAWLADKAVTQAVFRLQVMGFEMWCAV